jgi:hypothetical protein
MWEKMWTIFLYIYILTLQDNHWFNWWNKDSSSGVSLFGWSIVVITWCIILPIIVIHWFNCQEEGTLQSWVFLLIFTSSDIMVVSLIYPSVLVLFRHIIILPNIICCQYCCPLMMFILLLLLLLLFHVCVCDHCCRLMTEPQLTDQCKYMIVALIDNNCCYWSCWLLLLRLLVLLLLRLSVVVCCFCWEFLNWADQEFCLW